MSFVLVTERIGKSVLDVTENWGKAWIFFPPPIPVDMNGG